MFKIFNKKSDIVKVAEKELEENKEVLESLRDYDTGKKEISTDTVEKRFRDIQSAP